MPGSRRQKKIKYRKRRPTKQSVEEERYIAKWWRDIRILDGVPEIFIGWEGFPDKKDHTWESLKHLDDEGILVDCPLEVLSDLEKLRSIKKADRKHFPPIYFTRLEEEKLEADDGEQLDEDGEQLDGEQLEEESDEGELEEESDEESDGEQLDEESDEESDGEQLGGISDRKQLDGESSGTMNDPTNVADVSSDPTQSDGSREQGGWHVFTPQKLASTGFLKVLGISVE